MNSVPLRVVYAGYHIETLLLLCEDGRFDVVGTGLIDEFVTCSTCNPVNALFKIVYILRCQNQYRLLEIVLLRILMMVSICATSFYRRYIGYLRVLSESRIEVVDFSNTISAIDFVKSKHVDIMVVNAWSILEEAIVTAPKFGTVNIHPSKLPQYRGALPTLWSLKNGDRESAITYFVVDKAVDTGSIISQHMFSIAEDDDWQSVEKRITELIQVTFASGLIGYVTGETKLVVQDESITSSTGKYLEYMQIDWSHENGIDICNKLNLYPFLVPDDYCFTYFGNKKIVLKKGCLSRCHEDMQVVGRYFVQGFTLYVQANSGVIACRLFSGVQFRDSLLFMLKRKGTFV